jgi:hypothetical protein
VIHNVRLVLLDRSLRATLAATAPAAAPTTETDAA